MSKNAAHLMCPLMGERNVEERGRKTREGDEGEVVLSSCRRTSLYTHVPLAVPPVVFNLQRSLVLF